MEYVRHVSMLGRLFRLYGKNNPVKANATLNVTRDGDLILADADGRIVWSTSTGGKSVAGSNLTGMGNRLLFDSKSRSVWQSFDHETDSLVLGQKLHSSQRLSSRISDSNSSQGIYSLAVENGTLVSYNECSPPQVYFYSDMYEGLSAATIPLDVKFENGSFDNYALSPAAQVMKLESDGHLRVYASSN
ncbi:EP1-like glycoprotein 2 [Coffea arabica]|uniref:EP1-like glycoprotein 2 n=1 Tax=Coffea arabica TaxID=13443 RepID=A0A6P6SB91_COFAR|nr:EP1-like glycoprotein 2 [Coffea arabica]